MTNGAGKATLTAITTAKTKGSLPIQPQPAAPVKLSKSQKKAAAALKQQDDSSSNDMASMTM